jgi:NADH-quinone oxidoreductase subunit E
VTTHELEEFLAPMRHEYADPRSLILPALRHAQGDAGWLDPQAMAAVAEATGFSQAYVESVASFYDRLYLEPVGRRVINVCVTLSCMLRGSDEIFEHLADYLGLDGEGTTDDGMFSLHKVQCIGACDRAPCLQIDAGQQIGPLEPADATCLVDDLREAAAPARYDR